MNAPVPPAAAAIHDPFAMRRAGRELLSLAFIDARNRTLRWLGAFAGAELSALRAEFEPPLWLIGHAAWFQECAIARNLQRARGGRSAGATLASIEPRADAWFDPSVNHREQRWQNTELSDAHLRDYLAATLETTLELLDKADETDAGLHLFRLALSCEDQVSEMLGALAQAAGLGAVQPTSSPAALPVGTAGLDPSGGADASIRELWPIWPSRARREPLWFGAQTWPLGSARGGFVPDNERWAHDEPVPEFEIDAQPVQWAQFVEFAEDGGYDERRWWSEAGWAWVERSERRAPRYVEQLGQAVLARRAGRVQRLAANQAAAHLSWYEADAWCRWAQRRLPTEVEWEIAAAAGAARGFVWGDVHEWVAGRARRWSDEAASSVPPSVCDGPAPWPSQRVMRGASVMTVPRLKHPKARHFAGADADAAFVGFRSCALML